MNMQKWKTEIFAVDNKPLLFFIWIPVFLICRRREKSCLMHFVRHLLASRLDAALPRQTYRECIQLLNHLGLVARQHWSQNCWIHFSFSLLWFVLCCLCTLFQENEKGGKDLWWGKYFGTEKNTSLLSCSQPQPVFFIPLFCLCFCFIGFMAFLLRYLCFTTFLTSLL